MDLALCITLLHCLLQILGYLIVKFTLDHHPKNADELGSCFYSFIRGFLGIEMRGSMHPIN